MAIAPSVKSSLSQVLLQVQVLGAGAGINSGIQKINERGYGIATHARRVMALVDSLRCVPVVRLSSCLRT